MTNNPFGFPENAAERFLREEVKRAQFYKSMIGGGAVAEAIKQANTRQKLLRDLGMHSAVQTTLDLLEQDRANQQALKSMTSAAWALSVAETAHTISHQNADLIEQQRLLSSSVLDTVRAFDRNRGAVATAIARAKADIDFRQMVTGTLAALSTYGAIAEEMRRLDSMTLRASHGVLQSATSLVAEMVLETRRIAEAIAATSGEEDSAELVGELFETILGYLVSLGPKTINEISNMGLVGWSGWFFGMVGLVLTVMAIQPNQSPQQQAAITELNQKYEELKEQQQRHNEAEALAGEAYVADLPRAELARDATFRRKPERAGEVVLKAHQGMVLAIEKSEGRWHRVVFRDPLSDQLSSAWVYATAVTPLADPLDSPGGTAG